MRASERMTGSILGSERGMTGSRARKRASERTRNDRKQGPESSERASERGNTSICLGHRQLFSRFGGIGERHKISHRDLCINNNKVSVCSVDGASSCGLNGPAFELVAESLSVVTSIRTQVSHLDGRQTPPLVSPII